MGFSFFCEYSFPPQFQATFFFVSNPPPCWSHNHEEWLKILLAKIDRQKKLDPGRLQEYNQRANQQADQHSSQYFNQELPTNSPSLFEQASDSPLKADWYALVTSLPPTVSSPDWNPIEPSQNPIQSLAISQDISGPSASPIRIISPLSPLSDAWRPKQKDPEEYERDRVGKYAPFIQGDTILPIPDYVEALESRIIFFIISTINAKKLAGICREIFEEMMRISGISCRYFRRRGYHIYPTPPLGQNMTQGHFLSVV